MDRARKCFVLSPTPYISLTHLRHFSANPLSAYCVIKSVVDKISRVDGWLSAFIYGTPITYSVYALIMMR